MSKASKVEKVGYKSPPTAHQWQPGQSGNPSGKKKAAGKPPQPLQEILARLLQETTLITIAGKKQEITLAELLLRKLLHNSINAPLNQQALVLKLLIGLGLIDPQKVFLGLEEDDFDPFTEEQRRLLEIVKEELKDCDLDG